MQPFCHNRYGAGWERGDVIIPFNSDKVCESLVSIPEIDWANITEAEYYRTFSIVIPEKETMS